MAPGHPKKDLLGDVLIAMLEFFKGPANTIGYRNRDNLTEAQICQIARLMDESAEEWMNHVEIRAKQNHSKT